MRRRVLSGLRGRRPAQGEADHKLLHAWAWGTEPQPISLGQLQCLPAEHIGRATSLRKTQNRPSAQAKDIATTSACSSASSDSQKQLSNSAKLSEHKRSHPALCPPERSQISAINPPPPPNASQYMADNSLADILILAILCLAGIGSAAYVVLRRLQRVEERALGDVELQDLKRDEDLTFEGQVVKGDVFLPQGL